MKSIADDEIIEIKKSPYVKKLKCFRRMYMMTSGVYALAGTLHGITTLIEPSLVTGASATLFVSAAGINGWLVYQENKTIKQLVKK